MKRKLLLSFTLLASAMMMNGQTAVDFTVNDCAGTSHHLFGELDAGKVVVIAFVDPCASCIAPSGTALGIVQSFASSYPGRVLYYLSDDVANTSCTTLTSWGNTNGITGVPVFSSTSVLMADYGGPAMPKIVVLGGYNHAVLFTQNNGLNSANFTAAIQLGLQTGIDEASNVLFDLNLYPNPTTSAINMKYTLKENAKTNVDIYNLIGEKIKSIALDNATIGANETSLSTEGLTNGAYVLKITSGSFSEYKNFTIAK